MIRIGTRDSQLAVWQATQVKNLLENLGTPAALELVKSEGDLDQVTPLYSMGVQGVFTRVLDTALLNNRIDVAVHSMKDVPVQLPEGIVETAVLERASYNDILVLNPNWQAPDDKSQISDLRSQISGLETLNVETETFPLTIATSSVRRKAQWLHRFPGHTIENIRGNVNTRLRKLAESNWFGAIFAEAGLDRIGLKPANSISLNWMLPAPAQGAIMITARKGDTAVLRACSRINHAETAYCVKAERDFLSALMGGCATPISALATIHQNNLHFKGSIVTPDGWQKIEMDETYAIDAANAAGKAAAAKILEKGAGPLIAKMNHAQ
ncbi:hydroxymethylbilane synthase [Niabella sp. CC-SYL272]|uniref:hydroxymethylbilane synthase n=1 Tax=Niabella agricola TaxID=2891571 RepID=UPI001F01AAD5|nr:hydroxymethylbilane synthase [Niabella agricola]MCF3110362.1 hydroxymethylbilane synthase [Niabella agricola]